MRSESTAHAISRREARGSVLLWFGLLAAPLAWVTQLVINYSLEEWFACSPGGDSGDVLGIHVPDMALIVTGTLGAVALAGGLTALHCYRKLRAATETDSRAKWMAVAGIMNSILYLIVILASVAPPLLLQVCELSP